MAAGRQSAPRRDSRSLALRALPLIGALSGLSTAAWAAQAQPPDVRLFFQAVSSDERESRAALEAIGASWRDGYAGMIVDIARLLRGASRRRPGSSEGSDVAAAAPDEERQPEAVRPPRDLDAGPSFVAADPRRQRLIRFLEKQTGQRFGDDLRAWRRWLWNRPSEPHPDLAAFKSALYGNIDPKMGAFFTPGAVAKIRLDEVDWGGVKVNGIPPLDHPKVVAADEARYLKGKNVVFGIVVNGEARAYPKRILAWHELALDRLGGSELAVVYCTLCGTVIPYAAETEGRRFTFGTSGLLYRSNKLMFDHETGSLWSTLEGRPVVGPLAATSLELRAYPVVTTTWEEWLKEHPETSVLSLDTGHERDYSEGAAYRQYFATDELMFDVPRLDERLKNKAEVLTLLLREPDGSAPTRRPLALSAEFLKRNPVHQLRFAGQDLLVVTSAAGANRVYAIPAGSRFVRKLAEDRLQDDRQRAWRLTEEALTLEANETVAPRVPARRAFWFAWQAQFPETELIR
jgi:hypothetical protein